MKIPKTLKVGGHKVKIKLVSPKSLDDDMGGWDAKTNTIKINKEITQSQKELTLFHEIIHSFNNELDEEKTEFFAQALYQVLSDNKMLR